MQNYYFADRRKSDYTRTDLIKCVQMNYNRQVKKIVMVISVGPVMIQCHAFHYSCKLFATPFIVLANCLFVSFAAISKQNVFGFFSWRWTLKSCNMRWNKQVFEHSKMKTGHRTYESSDQFGRIDAQSESHEELQIS